MNKEKVQSLIAQQRTNLADVSYLDLNSVNNIIQNFQNSSLSEKNPEKTSDLKLSAPLDSTDAQDKKYQEKVVTLQFSTQNHSQKVDFLKNGKAIPVKKDNIHLQKEIGKTATQQVIDQIENFKPETFSTEIGNVDIDEQSIHKSMGHRYGQKKLDVFPVLQKGFKNAVYIGYAPDWDGNNLTNHYFAFPIMYDGERNLVFCRVRADVNKTRLYVHEVYLEDNINKAAGMFQTAAEQDKTLKPHEHSNLYKNILSHFYIASGDFKKTFKFFVQVNPASEKNPEKSSGDLKSSMPGDRGDTSLDPVDYRRSIDPLFDFFMEYSDNGILNPGTAHIGEDFSGVSLVNMAKRDTL